MYRVLTGRCSQDKVLLRTQNNLALAAPASCKAQYHDFGINRSAQPGQGFIKDA